MTTEFHGTPEEAEALQKALARNCTCHYDEMGTCLERCPPHEALIEDQRFIDGLLCERNLRETLLKEEWMAE
jgi:hypothetical protein